MALLNSRKFKKKDPSKLQFLKFRRVRIKIKNNEN